MRFPFAHCLSTKHQFVSSLMPGMFVFASSPVRQVPLYVCPPYCQELLHLQLLMVLT
jgi:hypothetical protein